MLLLQLLLLLLLLGSFSTTTVSHTSSAPLPSRSSLQSILLLLNFIGFLLLLFAFIFCLVFFFYDLPRLFFLNLFCRIPKSARAISQTNLSRQLPGQSLLYGVLASLVFVSEGVARRGQILVITNQPTYRSTTHRRSIY